MPELPEVESVRRGLVAARLRAPVVAVWRSPYRLRVGKNWAEENLTCLEGNVPGDIHRRGKYIVWEFAGPGGAANGLVIHLGMSGRCGVTTASQPRVAHTHFALRMKDDREVRLVDPRRFGGLRAGPLSELWASEPLSTLGPEPLDPGFDGAVLAERLGTSRRPIRDALLDQEAVAGLGNIYAVEALFAAGIHPLVAARRLHANAWERLAGSIVTVLRRGIENGGTTLKDFRNVAGEVGRNQDDLRVYGRAGEGCPRCRTSLEGFVSGGRSGAFCPRCQPRPRTRVVR
ncbi:MAG TPA: bifunctional DNA-formamidopyrimidine glycosylase/DNA-(apurinic or apyrimidinic site) lyase [Nannocystis sp.]